MDFVKRDRKPMHTLPTLSWTTFPPNRCPQIIQRIRVIAWVTALLLGYHQGLAQTCEEAPADSCLSVPCFAPDAPPEFVAAFNKRLTESWASRDPAVGYNLQRRWGGGALGQPITITWSIIPDGTPIPTNSAIGDQPGGSAFESFLAFVFGSVDAGKQKVRQAFAEWSAVSGINFVEVADDGAAFPASPGVLNGGTGRGDIRVGMKYFLNGLNSVLAYAYFPDNGDVVFNASAKDSYNTGPNDYRAFRNTLAHELGHALGLLHVCPQNGTKLMEPQLNTFFDGPQHDEVRGVNRAYGDRYEPNNSTTQPADLGTFRPVMEADAALDRLGDVDVYSFLLQEPRRVTVTLSPTGMTYQDFDQLGDGSCPSFGPTVNSLAIQNLRVELISPDRQSVLASSDVAPAGQPESIPPTLLRAPGRYYVRVTGAGTNDVQAYHLKVAMQYEVMALGMPPGFDAPSDYIVANRMSSDGRIFVYTLRIVSPSTYVYRDFVWSAGAWRLLTACDGVTPIRALAISKNGEFVVFVPDGSTVLGVRGPTGCASLPPTVVPIPQRGIMQLCINSFGSVSGTLDGNAVVLQPPNYAAPQTVGIPSLLRCYFQGVYPRGPAMTMVGGVINDAGDMSGGSRTTNPDEGCDGWVIHNGVQLNVSNIVDREYFLQNPHSYVQSRRWAALLSNGIANVGGPYFWESLGRDIYGLVLLPTPEGGYRGVFGLTAVDANSVGEWVGWADAMTPTNSSSQVVAFQGVPNRLLDLVTPGTIPSTPPQLPLPRASGIDDRGRVVVTAWVGPTTADAHERLFLLDPRPHVSCPADVDDGTATGTPDGGVTIDDLLYFLVLFGDGSVGADLDDGSGQGRPDGGVTIEDLLFYLDHFTAGC